jgi:hypothetical protein
MALLNPRFEDAGAEPGDAANWTLQTAVAGQSAAGFGPDPASAAEDFERWYTFAPAFDPTTAALGFFAPLLHGYEDFERGWSNDTFQAALSGGDADVCLFGGSSPAESFESGWSNAPPVTDWSTVAAQQALFEAQPVEAFEAGWEGNENATSTWGLVPSAQALFGGAPPGIETFETTWASATTI